jgi:hypothetical protein
MPALWFLRRRCHPERSDGSAFSASYRSIYYLWSLLTGRSALSSNAFVSLDAGHSPVTPLLHAAYAKKGGMEEYQLSYVAVLF